MNFRATVLLVGLGLCTVLPAQAITMYCCSDDKGHKTCGDVLPQICYGRAYQEISGGVVKEVAAPLTEDQKTQRQADAKRKTEMERAALDERRRNQALLDTYASVKDIDYMRDHALAGIGRELQQAQDKYNEALKHKQELAKQAAPYKTTPIPDELAGQIRTNDDDLKGQQRVLDTKQKEMDDIRAKFEVEKSRYLELTHGDKHKDAAAESATGPTKP